MDGEKLGSDNLLNNLEFTFHLADSISRTVKFTGHLNISLNRYIAVSFSPSKATLIEHITTTSDTYSLFV